MLLVYLGSGGEKGEIALDEKGGRENESRKEVRGAARLGIELPVEAEMLFNKHAVLLEVESVDESHRIPEGDGGQHFLDSVSWWCPRSASRK